MKENAQKSPENKVETWISNGFREHVVVAKVEGEPTSLKFNNYKYEVDTSTKRGKAISDALRSSGRYGRDLFVVGDTPIGLEDASRRADMLRKLRDMTVPQLRAMLSLDDLIDSGVPANTTDSDDLIAVILAKKSL